MADGPRSTAQSLPQESPTSPTAAMEALAPPQPKSPSSGQQEVEQATKPQQVSSDAKPMEASPVPPAADAALEVQQAGPTVKAAEPARQPAATAEDEAAIPQQQTTPRQMPPQRPPEQKLFGQKATGSTPVRGNAASRSSTAPAPRHRHPVTPVKPPVAEAPDSPTAPPAEGPHTKSSQQVDVAPPAAASPAPPAAASAEPLADGKASGSSLGEAWEAFLDRTRSRLDPAKMEPLALFETFRTSGDLGVIFASFAHLFHAATQTNSNHLPPWSAEGHAWEFPYDPIRVHLGGHWKAKQLWEKLDKRRHRQDVVESHCDPGGRLTGRRAVVVGAGPAGLYIAVHLRLLGIPVTVIERRESFSRINQLHLWHWCGEEIKALGARCLEPPPQDFGSNPDLLSIGISDLQTLLFKTALLLGVEVLMGVDFKSADWRNGGWQVQLEKRVAKHDAGPGQAKLDEVSPVAPEFVSNVGVLIGTDGSDCMVGKFFGIETVELGNLRSEDAIGLVCNFTRVPTLDKPLRSFALARQFYGPLFQQLADQTGCELENIVYTKSTGSHYFVTTPTRRSLHSTGVLRDLAQKPLLSQTNVDKAALDTFIRSVVSFPFKGDQVPLSQALSDSMQYADKGPQLFDFSKLRRASSGIVFASPPGQAGSSTNGELLVALAGDALLEPFWPEGLGIVRGFLSSLDVTAAVAQWAAGDSAAKVEQKFSEAFTQLKTLGARTRGSVLRDDEKLFALPPASRYRSLKAAA